MILAEFTVDHPILRKPLTAVPGIEVEWEQTFEHADGQKRMLCWVTNADFGAFEAAVGRDPGTTNPRVMIDLGDRRLYRIDYTDVGHRTDLYPIIVEAGGVLQTVVGTNDGWLLRVQIPSRKVLEGIFQFCRDNDIDFALRRIYEETTWTGENGPTLTEGQRETLIEAVDCGYLEIPRDCSLADLGEHLGISESAASERFRRAVKNLVEQTVYSSTET